MEAGITFNCAEQAMMYGKAVLFHDREIAEKVLITVEPREQKQLGRLVKNFDDKIWKEKSKRIVYAAYKAKFTQNQELLKALIRAAGTTLVELAWPKKIRALENKRQEGFQGGLSRVKQGNVIRPATCAA
ncbi:NADAR family protein [Brevibacillus centrosporus]|uniref:NADAR family protein n=1 Tax=Brevibacillus centrosporus TaxID=54910 RepID=UPI002E1ACF44